MTALTVYYTNTASTTLSTANKLSITHGTDNTNVTQDYTLVGTAVNWGEVYAQGNTSAWAAGASIGSPSGHGFLLESGTLNLAGNTIAAGSWSANVRLAMGHTDGTLTGSVTGCEIHVRVYKYNAGTYTSIIDMSLTGQTINSTNTTFALSGTASAVSFSSGDLLYCGIWVKVGTNTNGDAALNIRLNRLSTNFTGDSNAEVVTPGYSATGTAASVSAPVRVRVKTNVNTSLPLRTLVSTLARVSIPIRAYVAGSTAQYSVPIRTPVATPLTASLPIRFVVTSPPTLVPYSVFVNGQQVTVVAGSLTITNTVGRRSQASFQCRTTTATHFQQYQVVKIYDQYGILVFNGYISSPTEKKPGFQSSLLHTIQAIDQHFLADKRRVVASYTNRTCGSIVQDIANTVLANEGVTIGQIYDGLTPSTTLYPATDLYPGGNVGLIPAATFAYAKVSDALDELVKQASSAGVPYYWQIDEQKRLWFVPYTAVVNSTVVDGTQIDQVLNPPTVSRQNPTYRNVQYITGGIAQTSQQTQQIYGDGVTTSWPLSYAVASQPSITVNGVTKTVGLKGSSGYDFYWQSGDPVIAQDSSATPLVVVS